MFWHILDTPPSSAQHNMEIDRRLLNDLPAYGYPVLHFYEWSKKSITHGYFIEPSKYINVSHLKNLDLHLAQRPTGGGILFHWVDFTFSIILPNNFPQYSTNTLSNYALVNHWVADAIQNLIGKGYSVKLLEKETSQPCVESACNFCMAQPTIYDVTINNKKVAGGAQRRTKHGLLHQGSISLAVPENEVIESLLWEGQTIERLMLKNSFPLLQVQSNKDVIKKELRQQLIETVVASSE